MFQYRLYYFYLWPHRGPAVWANLYRGLGWQLLLHLPLYRLHLRDLLFLCQDKWLKVQWHVANRMWSCINIAFSQIIKRLLRVINVDEEIVCQDRSVWRSVLCNCKLHKLLHYVFFISHRGYIQHTNCEYRLAGLCEKKNSMFVKNDK